MHNEKKVRHIKQDPLSHCSIPIGLFFKETEQCLGKATGFIYEYEKRFYLITNWHNVTGLNPITKEQIGNHGGRPNQLELILGDKDKFPILDWIGVKIDLYLNDKPDWLIHPIHKEKVDVVAIELIIEGEFRGDIRPINNVNLDNQKVEVGDDVFILGYPYSLKGGGYFPIWKRGSVATEPDIDIDGLPKFLIDSASKKGMSGSPVIFRRTGIHGIEKGKITLDTTIGRIQNFVGIYSGRLTGKSEFDAQLGIVWKPEVIEEIINGNTKEDQSFL